MKMHTPAQKSRFAVAAGLLMVAIVWFVPRSLKSADEPPAAVVRIVPPEREKPLPGSVHLKNGLILSGMCSPASTLAPQRRNQSSTDRQEQKLMLRLINQGAREVYVSVHRSDPAVLDNGQWPVLTLPIQQQRQARKPLPQGIPEVGPFDENGIAIGKLHTASGPVDIQVGITSINELFAEVMCLTHDWNYTVSIDAIPRQNLAGILKKVKDYDTQAIRRLELVRILTKADRLPEASLLLAASASDFPEVAAQQATSQQLIREQLARQIISVLEQRRDVGQHQLAANGARVHPKHDLTPQIRVRVGQLIRYYDDIDQRIDHVRTSLSMLVADIEDPALRESATVINRLVSAQIDADTINRFSAFELIASPAPVVVENDAAAGEVIKVAAAAPEGLPKAEEQLAMAFSGWLMGAEGTVGSLADTASLFEARQTIIDYLATEESEVDRRRTLAGQIAKLEGAGIDRIAAIVRNLPVVQPINIESAGPGTVGLFEIPSAPGMAGAIGMVPPEYHESRQYPVLIAFQSEFGDAGSYLSWWQSQCEKYGYIIVVPMWHVDPAIEQPKGPPAYNASAETHIQFLSLVRRLKNSLRLDDDRMFVAGHGIGGEAAMDMAASHTDLFAGVISICGMGRKSLQFTAQNAIQLPWYVVIGDSQGNWFDRMGTLAAKLFKRDEETDLYFDTMFVKYPYRGIEPYLEEFDDVFEWMSRHKRNPRLEMIYARLLRSTDLHWSWLQLDSLPEQFAKLDAPSLPTDIGFRPAELKVRCNDKNHVIIEAAPAGMTLFLSPDLPGLDVNKPIHIDKGRKHTVIDFDPKITDLLEELYRTGDRSRLCYMKVVVEK